MAEAENTKPFKTIEVVDRHTGQACKVACMSCIRGHRTTSCGIPVCRSKVFWTVKRPGRPSNSCTCRYGATGGCRCVTARTVCPHKPKKGEKRSGECRCDEQGRFCCLLEPENWKELMAMNKPVVDFFPSREALEDRQNLSTPMTMPSTPFSFPGSPHTSQNDSSTYGTPAPQHQTPISIVPSPYENLLSQRQASITPRFSMMDLESSQRSEATAIPNPLSWDYTPTQASEDFPPPQNTFQHAQQQEQRSSCCQSSAPSPAPRAPQNDFFSPPAHFNSTPTSQRFQPQPQPAKSCCQSGPPPQNQFSYNTPENQFNPNPNYQPPPQPYQPAPFDYDRLMATYQSYQYPNAICQKCGLNGCTCSNCPPTMQNFITGSWAQCCGRTHAMAPKATAFAPPPQMLATQPQTQTPTASLNGNANSHEPYPPDIFDPQHQLHEPMGLPSTQAPVGYEGFGNPDDLMLGLSDDGATAANRDLDLSEFLMEGLDRPT